CLQGYNVPYSF
nr:immunoglobulin light chain junction region [Macaca mulatta]